MVGGTGHILGGEEDPLRPLPPSTFALCCSAAATMLQGTFQQAAGQTPGAEPPRLPYESMSITVSEDRNSYTVKGQMVGVLKEDIDIDISDDRTLRIRAVRRASGGGMNAMTDPGQQGEQDPIVCQIGRNYILPKFADPDNMRADLFGTELVVVIYKSSDHIDKKKARIS